MPTLCMRNIKCSINEQRSATRLASQDEAGTTALSRLRMLLTISADSWRSKRSLNLRIPFEATWQQHDPGVLISTAIQRTQLSIHRTLSDRRGSSASRQSDRVWRTRTTSCRIPRDCGIYDNYVTVGPPRMRNIIRAAPCTCRAEARICRDV